MEKRELRADSGRFSIRVAGEWRDSLRTFKWSDLIPEPQASLEQINHLLCMLAHSEDLLMVA